MPLDSSFVYFLVCGSTSLTMWYKMLNIIEAKGQDVKYFYSDPRYYFDFYRIIQNESKKRTRHKYLALLWGQFLIIPIYLIGMYYLFW